jgi:hypothetical protein
VALRLIFQASCPRHLEIASPALDYSEAVMRRVCTWIGPRRSLESCSPCRRDWSRSARGSAPIRRAGHVFSPRTGRKRALFREGPDGWAAPLKHVLQSHPLGCQDLRCQDFQLRAHVQSAISSLWRLLPPFCMPVMASAICQQDTLQRRACSTRLNLEHCHDKAHQRQA